MHRRQRPGADRPPPRHHRDAERDRDPALRPHPVRPGPPHGGRPAGRGGGRRTPARRRPLEAAIGPRTAALDLHRLPGARRARRGPGAHGQDRPRPRPAPDRRRRLHAPARRPPPPLDGHRGRPRDPERRQGHPRPAEHGAPRRPARPDPRRCGERRAQRGHRPALQGQQGGHRRPRDGDRAVPPGRPRRRVGPPPRRGAPNPRRRRRVRRRPGAHRGRPGRLDLAHRAPVDRLRRDRTHSRRGHGRPAPGRSRRSWSGSTGASSWSTPTACAATRPPSWPGGSGRSSPGGRPGPDERSLPTLPRLAHTQDSRPSSLPTLRHPQHRRRLPMDFRTLANAWQAGALSRRAFLERAAALGARCGRRRPPGGPCGPARRGPDDPEARARDRPGRRRLEARPPLLDLVERHPGDVQRLRQPDEPPPGRQAPARASPPSGRPRARPPGRSSSVRA